MKALSLLFAATLLTVVGCSPSSSTENDGQTVSVGVNNANSGSNDGDSKGVLAISVLTMTNPFFKELADSFRDAAIENGYEVMVVSGEKDVARQQDQVKDFIVKGVSAIALCPCDSKSIGPAIEEANQAGIPVFTADIACLAPGAQVVSHIATDNYSGGKMAGEAMIEALGEAGGEIAILDYKSAESCLLRVQGFKEVIEAHNANPENPRIEIVAELPGEGARNEGFKVTEDVLQSNPNLAGIFAINDLAALGANAALEKAGKAKQVQIVGFDGQPEGIEAIDQGIIYADPIQFPGRIGRQTVETIVKYFNGEEVPKEILIPTELYKGKDASANP